MTSLNLKSRKTPLSLNTKALKNYDKGHCSGRQLQCPFAHTITFEAL